MNLNTDGQDMVSEIRDYTISDNRLDINSMSMERNNTEAPILTEPAMNIMDITNMDPSQSSIQYTYQEHISSNQDLSIDFLRQRNNNNTNNNLNNISADNVVSNNPIDITINNQIDINAPASSSSNNFIGTQENEQNPQNELDANDRYDDAREILFTILKWHSVGFFLLLFILLYIKFDVSYFYPIVFLWLVDTYDIISAINGISESVEPVTKCDHFVNIIESVSWLIFKILLLITFQTTWIKMLYTLTPFGVIAIAKIMLCLCKKKIDTPFFLTLFFVLQWMNICLKCDKIVDWNWKEVFWAYWVAFSLMIGITLAIVLLFLNKCATYIFSPSHRYEVRGIFWLALISAGVTTFSCCFVITFINYLDLRTDNSLDTVSNIIIGILGYCLLITKISSTYFGKVNENDLKKLKENEATTQKEQKKSSKTKHIRPISFDYALLTKNSENLREIYADNGASNPLSVPTVRAKDDMSGSQEGNVLTKTALELIEFKKILENSFIDKINKKDNINTSIIKEEQSANNQSANKIHYPLELEPVMEINTSVTSALPFHNQILPNGLSEAKTISKKPCYHKRFQSAIALMRPKSLSINEINNKEKNKNESSENKEGSQLHSDRSVTTCLICFDKVPDAVFMECGHGGVCYECSIEVWKSTGECYLCRKSITQILQLDLRNFALSKIIKVISSTQMVNCEEDQLENESVDGE